MDGLVEFPGIPVDEIIDNPHRLEALAEEEVGPSEGPIQNWKHLY